MGKASLGFRVTRVLHPWSIQCVAARLSYGGAPQELDPFGELLLQMCLRDQVHKRVQREGGTGDDMLHALFKGVAEWWYPGDRGFQTHLCKKLTFSWYPCGIRAEVPRISWYPLVHL